MFNKLLTLKPEIFIKSGSHQSVVITAAVYSCTKQIHIKYESNSFFRPPFTGEFTREWCKVRVGIGRRSPRRFLRRPSLEASWQRLREVPRSSARRRRCSNGHQDQATQGEVYRHQEPPIDFVAIQLYNGCPASGCGDLTLEWFHAYKGVSWNSICSFLFL